METKHLKLSEIKPNPDNPRFIKDEMYQKLVESIKQFPQMLELRPIVVNDDNIVLGGNMRLKACKEAGLKTIPVLKASQLTPEQQKEFIIKDNVSFGQWDYDALANSWELPQLEGWGLEIPDVSLQNKNVDMKMKPVLHKKGLFYFISLFKAREEIGVSLEDFKKEPANELALAGETTANVFT